MKTKTKITKTKAPDSIILGIVLALLVFGLMMISSAGVYISEIKFDDEFYYFKHQLFFGIIPGIIFLMISSRINYNFWKKISEIFFIFAILLLIAVFIPGLGVKLQGASRWLDLGPVSFQPTEMMKLAFIVYFAKWLEARREKIKDFQEGVMPFLIVLSVIGFLIMAQPDFGTLSAIVAIAILMFFLSGARLKHFLAIIFFGGLLFLILIKIEPYRMNRFLAFLNPQTDPQGISYQINQAFLAIGSGGPFGVGIGKSRQKFKYLPEPIGDSIFAIIGEELGLVGTAGLLIVFLALFLRGIKIAQNAPDFFARNLAFGITIWILVQSFMNIMAIIGLMPLTGIPLPFVSYGSTSLIFSLVGIGILLNISRYTKIKE